MKICFSTKKEMDHRCSNFSKDEWEGEDLVQFCNKTREVFILGKSGMHKNKLGIVDYYNRAAQVWCFLKFWSYLGLP